MIFINQTATSGAGMAVAKTQQPHQNHHCDPDPVK